MNLATCDVVAGHPPTVEGSAAVRPPRHGEDSPCQGCCHGVRDHVLQRLQRHSRLQVERRERADGASAIRHGAILRAEHHLLRRSGLFVQRPRVRHCTWERPLQPRAPMAVSSGWQGGGRARVLAPREVGAAGAGRRHPQQRGRGRRKHEDRDGPGSHQLPVGTRRSSEVQSRSSAHVSSFCPPSRLRGSMGWVGSDGGWRSACTYPYPRRRAGQR